MLGSNTPFDINDLQYPVAVTYKKDGIRAEIKTKIQSRSLKPIPNKQVNEFLEPIREFASNINRLIEGEIYIHGLPLNEISMFVNSTDINTRGFHNKIKKYLREGGLTHPFHYYTKLPSNIEFYIFDCIGNINESYTHRIARLKDFNIPEGIQVAYPSLIHTAEDLKLFYDLAISEGYEGLVLRDPYGKYKLGRSTFNEQLFLKMKPIETLTGTIIGVTERLKNTNHSFADERGYATKRNTLGNKKNTGIAAALVVMYKGIEIRVTAVGTEEYRKKLYNNVDEFIGRKIKFKGLLVGKKHAPRHPTMIEII